MAFSTQYIDRPNNPSGRTYGGYLINDGSHTVFISTNAVNNTYPVFEWLGNGDTAKGREIFNSPAHLSMPMMTLSASRYNGIVGSLFNGNQQGFIKGE